MKSALRYIMFFLFLLPISSVAQDTGESSSKEMVVMRMIGHKVMHYFGDSTSAIQPVKQLSENKYQIQFETPFSFETDSIITIIDEVLGSHLTLREYIVDVIDCESESIIFAYSVALLDSDDITPCLGRESGSSCYKINVTIIEQPQLVFGTNTISTVLSLLLLSLLAFGIFKLTKIQNKEREEANNEEGKLIGNSIFNEVAQYLKIDEEKIELTYKESKILALLSTSLNQVVSRDELQNKVWDDEGVLISRSLDMFISKLRKKLSGDPSLVIKNVHGKGYKLVTG